MEHTAEDVFGDGGGGGQQLTVTGGHGAGQDPCHDQTGQQSGDDAKLGHELCDDNDDPFRVSDGGNGAFMHHGQADDADEDGHSHGDKDPDGGNTTAELDLFRLFNGHEPEQDVRHPEVAQTPCCGAEGGQEAAIGDGRVGGCVIHIGHGQVAVHGGGVVAHVADAAGLTDAEADDADQRHGHDDGLHQVGGGGSHEAAGGGVGHDDSGGDDHSDAIVKAEQGGEQLAAGGEAGGSVGDEKDHDDHGGDAQEQVAVVLEAAFEEIGHGICTDVFGVSTQALGHNEPVQIGTDADAEGSPGDVADAGGVGQAGQTHQQPGGHIRRLGAHSGDQGTQLTAAQVEVAHGLAGGVGIPETQVEHECQIEHDRNDNADVGLGEHE